MKFREVLPLIFLAFLPMAATAEPPASVDSNDANRPAFPYVAKIIADNVYVRSGPGTNYYVCGKLSRLDRITVVGSTFTWSQIVPPAGSFSWISKQYVAADPNNRDTATVTASDVRVYVGSEFKEPMHSTTLQTKLNTGDKVKLLGEEKGDYLRIAPPRGACLWVSTVYTRPFTPSQKDLEDGAASAEQAGSESNIPATAVVAAAPVSTESQKLDEYYALQKRFEQERAKPLEQQDYTALKQAFTSLANEKNAGRAARYAGFALKQIDLCNLAVVSQKQLQQQEKTCQQTMAEIDKAVGTRLAEAPSKEKYAVIGYLKVTAGKNKEKLYQITNDAGKTLCYAIPVDAAKDLDLGKFIHHKLGLVGSIAPYPEKSSAIVRFSEIAEL